MKEQANERHAQIAKADLTMNLVKIQCTKDEEMRRVEAEMEPKRRQAELQTALNKLNAVEKQVRGCAARMHSFSQPRRRHVCRAAPAAPRTRSRKVFDAAVAAGSNWRSRHRDCAV